MQNNPVLGLRALGQSLWMDFIDRNLLRSGGLQRMIKDDGLAGLTSNPTIWDKAIGSSDAYDNDITSLTRQGKSVPEIFEFLAKTDLQAAADELRQVYDENRGGDGYVSLEVSPGLAHDTDGTIAEARRYWKMLDRPNVMVKVPGTAEGLPAIRQLTSEGINVNVTLLFGLPRYREVVDAYLSGLEARAAQGTPLDQIASVASFFLSRIDVLVDPELEKLAQGAEPQAGLARSLHGQAAIASAKVAYQIYLELFAGPRWAALAQRGARPQRLLWASTSTKNPAYSDVKYVEPLIGPHTINTMPVETIEAYRDHGRPQLTIDSDVHAARQVLEGLGQLGINIDRVTQQLEDEGVQKFAKSFEHLGQALSAKRQEMMARQAAGR